MADGSTALGRVSEVALDGMRKPFPPNQISKLPKPTKAQTDALKDDFKKGVRCKVCGSWHHPDVVHLDYVGHAALTDRLLDVDPTWSWEPVAFRDGLPAFDATGGLWIKLTVCGVTRLGYGHAAAKPNMDPGAREKEVIGDALRNAAMRFGAALDLWHKGDLHAAEDAGQESGKDVADQLPPDPEGIAYPRPTSLDPKDWSAWSKILAAAIRATKAEAELGKLGADHAGAIMAAEPFVNGIRSGMAELIAKKRAALQAETAKTPFDDEIPF